MILSFILIVALAVAGAYLLSSEKLRGWRTQVFAGVLTALGGIVPVLNEVFGYLSVVDWRSYVSTQYLPFVVIGIGVMVALLRAVTSTPMGQK